jgi:hypothetical protein
VGSQITSESVLSKNTPPKSHEGPIGFELE